MHQEERSAVAAAVDGDKRVPVFGAVSPGENLCKLPGSGSVIENAKRRSVAVLFLDERKQGCRGHGVATHQEEVIVGPNVGHAQDTAPESEKRLEQFRLGQGRACEWGRSLPADSERGCSVEREFG